MLFPNKRFFYINKILQIGCDSFIIITNSPVEINIKRVFVCKQGTERERQTH